MSLLHLIAGTAISAFAVAFYSGRVHRHTKGWNALTANEKEKIAIKALCHNIGLVMAACGLLFYAGGLSLPFREHGFVLSVVCWLIAAGIDVLYIQKSKRFIGQ